jgi:hypothetical protein
MTTGIGSLKHWALAFRGVIDMRATRLDRQTDRQTDTDQPERFHSSSLGRVGLVRALLDLYAALLLA